MLKGKKILVGVTGSIASYKTANLVRLLVQSGAEVRVVLSPGALEFITPLTFSTLSKNPVHSDFTEDRERGAWTKHVDVALWADLMVIAPLTANTLAKIAVGQCDNFLLAVYMSVRCQVMVVPAMDHDMYLHDATIGNLETLKSFGHIVLSSDEGELASGLSGKGRMREPSDILDHIVEYFHPSLPMKGKVALITAGPTYEMIDPVRFIGNFSSGKMGFAIASQLADLGAKVHLIAGPVHLQISHPNIERIDVVSAAEMLKSCVDIFPHCDIAVMAAAVADYKPAVLAGEKIKKDAEKWELLLEKTTDIAAHLGTLKSNGQLLIGFALETEGEIEHAQQKLIRKNLDMIVLNSLRDEGAGFGTDTNKITLIWPGNKTQQFGLKSKSKVAADIVSEIARMIGQ